MYTQSTRYMYYCISLVTRKSVSILTRFIQHKVHAMLRVRGKSISWLDDECVCVRLSSTHCVCAYSVCERVCVYVCLYRNWLVWITFQCIVADSFFGSEQREWTRIALPLWNIELTLRLFRTLFNVDVILRTFPNFRIVDDFSRIATWNWSDFNFLFHFSSITLDSLFEIQYANRKKISSSIKQ